MPRELFMNRFGDIHSEPNATPLRRDAHYRVLVDGQDNRRDILLEGKTIALSQEGSIDCATVSVAAFYHCGHPASDPMGMQCAEPGCGNISCQVCSAQARCARCLKPLCLEHVQPLQVPNGVVKLCARCRANLIRRQRWQSVFRALLSPFVSCEKGENHDCR